MDEVAAKVKILEGVNDVLTVAGRADVVVLTSGTLEDISKVVSKVGEVEDVKTTETLIELVG